MVELIYSFEIVGGKMKVRKKELVRCKDCKYWEYKCQGDCNLIYGDCLYWQTEHHSDYYMETTGEHYCGFAERKETDE